MSTTSNLDDLVNRTIDHFWETIPPTWHSIRSNLQKIITENFDITVEQFHILRHIHKGLHSTSELAAEKQISRPAISQIVDTLVGKGLITRQTDAEDRRYIRLELTQAGLNLLVAIFDQNRVWMVAALSVLEIDELKALPGALHALHRAFGEPTE